MNRWYFLSNIILSFTTPLLDLNFVSFGKNPDLLALTLPEIQINEVIDISNSSSALFYLYLLGCIITFISLLYKIYLVKKGLNTQNSGDAYSFLHLIKVDPELVGYDKIVAHEQIHIKQLHSLDILIFEAIKIVNWFNPIVYLLIRSVKLNHEYIADQETATFEDERVEYANLLVSQIFNTHGYSLKNNFFNKPFLKKRIVMLFKNKSKKSVLVRFSLLIPIMMVAFAFQAEKTSIINGSTPNDKGSLNVSTTLLADTNLLFTEVEIMPQPIGGFNAFYQYIGKNFAYPKEAIAAKVEGKVVTRFIIEKNGTISNVEIIKDLGYGTGEEAVRVLEESPKWKPGIQNGREVRVQFTLPIQLNPKVEEVVPSVPASSKD